MSGRPELLPELQAAVMLGFCVWRQWRAARRAHLVPAPVMELPDGPRWSRAQLEAWVAGRPCAAGDVCPDLAERETLAAIQRAGDR